MLICKYLFLTWKESSCNHLRLFQGTGASVLRRCQPTANSGLPPRATDQGQRADHGSLTSGAVLLGRGVGTTRGCSGDPWPHRDWLGPQGDCCGAGVLA